MKIDEKETTLQPGDIISFCLRNGNLGFSRQCKRLFHKNDDRLMVTERSAQMTGGQAYNVVQIICAVSGLVVINTNTNGDVIEFTVGIPE